MQPWKSEFQHVGISVADLDRSVRWYTTLFGFTETKRFRKDELEITGAVLQLGAMTLEVLAPFTPVAPALPPPSLVEQLRKVGTNHIAVTVSDLVLCRERIAAAGCRMIGPVVDGRFFFCSDPDGVVLEIRKG
jgi:methylmalonyl-CoA/ethylmalonyl-CoA epimerase